MSISESVRDRIVGAIFLLSLAGILLPMWFDGAGVGDLPEVQPQVAPIKGVAPAPMVTDGPDWAFADETEAAAKAGPIAETGGGATAERTLAGQPQARSDLEARTAGGAELPWSIQVAALSDRSAGRQLKDKLIAAGFHAYVTDTVARDGKVTVRISVGPIIDRAEAERTRAALRAQFGFDGMMKKYDL